MARLTLPPSWMIETSADNYQAGYIFDVPLRDLPMAERLMDAIIAANMSDPGANGVSARNARLPVAVNTKHDPAFQCRLVQWHPELKYSYDDLVRGLQLDVREKGKKNRQKPVVSHGGGDEIYIPCADENPVIQALQDRGLYKKPLGDGKHDMTCPWVREHTDAVDGGTAYFEPDDTFPIGGFKCQHGHCAKRHVSDLLEFLNIQPTAARMKTTIRVIAGFSFVNCTIIHPHAFELVQQSSFQFHLKANPPRVHPIEWA